MKKSLESFLSSVGIDDSMAKILVVVIVAVLGAVVVFVKKRKSKQND